MLKRDKAFSVAMTLRIDPILLFYRMSDVFTPVWCTETAEASDEGEERNEFVWMYVRSCSLILRSFHTTFALPLVLYQAMLCSRGVSNVYMWLTSFESLGSEWAYIFLLCMYACNVSAWIFIGCVRAIRKRICSKNRTEFRHRHTHFYSTVHRFDANVCYEIRVFSCCRILGNSLLVLYFQCKQTQQQNEKVLSHNFWSAFYSSYCHVNAVYFYWFYDFCALQISLVFFSRAYYCRTKWIYIAYSSWCYTSACYMNASLRVFQRMLLIEMQYFNQIF